MNGGSILLRFSPSWTVEMSSIFETVGVSIFTGAKNDVINSEWNKDSLSYIYGIFELIHLHQEGEIQLLSVSTCQVWNYHRLSQVFESETQTQGWTGEYRRWRIILTSLFSLALWRILSSIVPLQINLYTVTCFVCPKRWALSIACWSTVGFQSLS